MSIKRALIPILACALLLCGCDYIVLPEAAESSGPSSSGAWSAVATGIAPENGKLHIDITIRNDTGDWSEMHVLPDKPAIFTGGDGKSTNCETLFVGTGGHRLAPGFQMRGAITGTRAEPTTQLLYVECEGVEATPGSKLAIDYRYVTGEYNYYYPETNQADARLEIDLDELAPEMDYPIAQEIEGLILEPSAEIVAINDVVLTLTGVERTDSGLQFSWQTANPGEYPAYVHIGNPPVIGDDGILYGYYETPDIVSVPITPGSEKATWTTAVAVPQEVKGLYILLSVESKKQRLFVNYAVDITDR